VLIQYSRYKKKEKKEQQATWISIKFIFRGDKDGAGRRGSRLNKLLGAEREMISQDDEFELLDRLISPQKTTTKMLR